MAWTFKSDGEQSAKLHSSAVKAALAAAHWLNVSAQNKSFPTVQLCEVAAVASDPAGDFHRSNGCCDGSDPSACHKRTETEAADARIRARVEARELERNEYAGTEPSDVGVFYFDHRGKKLSDIPCPLTSHHSSLKMGDKCGACGWRA